MTTILRRGAAVAALLLATGCSAGAPTPGHTPLPSQTVTSGAPTPESAPATPTGSANPTGSLTSAAGPTLSGGPAACLTGRYRLARFVGVGDRATYGTGEGGDVTVAFDRGGYELAGAGQEPVRLTLAGQRADLSIDGTVKGAYDVRGDVVTFRTGKSAGTATLAAGKNRQTLTMAQVASVLAPDGAGTLACSADRAVVVFADVRLELER